MSGFFSSLFGGSNDSLKSDIGQSASLASFLNTTGTSDVATSSNFDKTLLSGNSGNVSKLLAPQISGIQARAQQQRQQLGEFGGRSGGTTGAQIASGDQANAQVNDMISNLTGKAAGELGSMGSGLIGQGMTAMNMNEQFSQQQMQNWSNSILGKGISSAASAAETYATGGLSAVSSGGSFAKGGGSALSSFIGS
jgi:hypothetical protein